MNKDVIDHVIKKVKREMDMCSWDNLIHDGGKESALETYTHILQWLEDLVT